MPSATTLRVSMIFICWTCRLAADTIYYGVGPGEKVFAEGVIVREENSLNDSIAYWYHENGLLKRRMCMSPKCRLAKSSSDERRALIDSWKNGGQAEITDREGQTTIVYDLQVFFVGPPGYMCFGCDRDRDARRILPVRVGGSTGSIKMVLNFDSVSTIELNTFSGISVVMANADKISGSIEGPLVPANVKNGQSPEQVPLRAKFVGWWQPNSTSVMEYSKVADDIKKIVFGIPPGSVVTGAQTVRQ